MKAWEKLEEKLNLLIGSLLVIFKAFVSKSTPASIKATIESRKGKPLIDLQALQVKLLSLKTVIDSFLGKITGAVGKFFNFFKTLDPKNLKPEKLFLIIVAFVSPFLGRIRDWYIAMKPTTMLAMVSMTTMGGLSSIVIYQEVQKISEKSRGPASEVVAEVAANTPSKRPSYYKKQERELRVRNISLPVHIGRSPASKKLVMDFTFVTSNRYIKEYFNSHDKIHLLKDKLNMTVQPILPDFPLEDDGKRVIKEKIKKEMQYLLEELKIEGSVEEIHIHSIVSG